MAAGDRRPLRPPPPPLLLLPLLLLSVVTSSVFSASLGSEGQYSVCNTRCCKVEPNCSAALHVTCRCENEPRVALRGGDFPMSVQSIEIYGVHRVTIYDHALLDLTSLAKLELRRIDKLSVHPNGLALQKNASLFTLIMDTVKTLKIESSAFSGFWERGTKIKIGYISKLYIQKNAFSFQSSSRSPILTIEEAKFLDMGSRAFNAPFRYLTLVAVNTKLCRRNTFSESILGIEMIDVKMGEVRENCIHGTGNLTWLSISKSNLGIVRHRGIHGEISNLKIHNSSIRMLEPNGFQLQVGNLSITRSAFHSIMIRGLNVLANSSIRLSQLTVHSLHKHALIALQGPRNQGKNRTSLKIYKLTVLRAEDGSLTFDKAINLKLHRLCVRAPERPVCPTSSWVRRLTGTKESEPLSETEKQIETMLQRDWLCRGHVDADHGDPASKHDHSGSELFGSVLAAAVLLVIIASLVIIKQHRGKMWVAMKGKKSDGVGQLESSKGKGHTSLVVTDSMVRRRQKNRGVASPNKSGGS